MSISNKIKQVVADISLIFYGLNKFKIYISSLKCKLKLFEEIDNEIPSNLSNVYNKIKLNKKYFSYQKEYEKLKLNVEEHNYKVNNIFSLFNIIILLFYNS